MTVREKPPYTIVDYENFIALPENRNKLFVLTNGEIVEVSPGRTSNSGLSYTVAFAVQLFCRERKLPCFISGGDGAYRIGENVVAPDFAYKPTPLSDDYPDPVAPAWVIEIVSPTDEAYEIRKKREIYLKAGILYWEMYPLSTSIDVYAPGQPPRSFGIEDILDGGDVLPDFKLPVKEIFA